MLEVLRVQNFAIIDRLDIRFGPGLNVVTGETGAGKSIMIQALTGLTGERLDQNVIRTGAKRAMVEGLFHLSPKELRLIEDIGLESEDPVVVRRVIGAGRAGFINDSPVTVQTLKKFGYRIVELLGQHEHQTLFRPENHLNYLDIFLKLDKKLKGFKDLYHRYLYKRQELKEYVDRMERIKEKKDLITYQLNEIKTADIKSGEEEILVRELELLKTAEKRRCYIDEIIHYFYDGKESAYELLARVDDLLNKLSLVDPEMRHDAQELKEILIQSEELGRKLASYREQIEFDPERIDEIMCRLETIRKIKKKYGGLDAIGDLKERLERELTELENYQFDLETKERELKRLEEEVLSMAQEISSQRVKGGEEIKRRVEGMLRELKMNGSFVIQFDRTELNDKGIDRVEFLITLNPGEEPRPLRKVASGGELSRIILVLKSIIAEKDQIPILIFDEIDTGIGGRVGELVGLKLAKLARHHQVICITHLPQIAKFADHHFLVEKKVRKGKTYTSLSELNRKGRILELARMIGGNRITETAKRKAEEMIEEARWLRSRI